jgi:hypothetical protein
MRLFSERIAQPSNPSSPTTMLLPSPQGRTDISRRWQILAMVMTSAALENHENLLASPPTPIVEFSAKRYVVAKGYSSVFATARPCILLVDTA